MRSDTTKLSKTLPRMACRARSSWLRILRPKQDDQKGGLQDGDPALGGCVADPAIVRQ